MLLVSCSQAGRSDSESQVAQIDEALLVGQNSLKQIADSTAIAKVAAKSIGVLFQKEAIKPCGATTCDWFTQPSQYCSSGGLPYGDLSVSTVGFCTAFFVGGDLVVTAGHCIMPNGVANASAPAYECGNRLIALDWEKTSSGTTPTSVARNKLFKCKKVVGHGGTLPPGFPDCNAKDATQKLIWPKCSNENPGADWAWMRVEPYDGVGAAAFPPGLVMGVGPLPTGVTTNALLVNHPDGTPKKADAEATIRAPIPDPKTGAFNFSTFQFDADVTPGSSGGPVMDRTTAMVYGLIAAFPDRKKVGTDIDIGSACLSHSNCTAGSGLCAHGSEATTLLYGIWTPRKPALAQLDGVGFESGMAVGLPIPFSGGYTGAVVRNDAGVVRLSLTDANAAYKDIAYFQPVASSAPAGAAFFAPSSIADGAVLPLTVVGDFTGDSVPEAIVGISGHSYYVGSDALKTLITNANRDYAIATTPSYDYLVTGHSLFMPDDINGDGILDIRAVRNDGSEDRYCGSTGGLSAICSGAGVRADLAADGFAEMVRLAKASDGTISWKANIYGPWSFTGMAFGDPVVAATGNFNGDVAPNGLAYVDIAYLSAGKPGVGMSSTGGGLTGNPLTFAATDNFIALRVGDSLGDDGIDDVEAVRDDGVVRIYQGKKGAPSETSVAKVGVDFTGIPTADGGDGKFMTVSGRGLNTVDRATASYLIAIDGTKTKKLNVQVFDGDLGGTNDLIRDGVALNQTCFRLLRDPIGDDTGIDEVISKPGNAFGDNRWTTLFSGDVDEAARNGSYYFYRVHVFLAETCTSPANPGIAAWNAFKIRTNASVSVDYGSNSILGLDAWGPRSAGIPAAPDLLLNDTDYDGIFSWAIDVDGAAQQVHLKDSDADRSDDAGAPGVSNGANAIAKYSVYGPMPMGGGSRPTLLADAIPSGNYDVLSTNQDTHTYDIAVNGQLGAWLWKWENVDAINNIQLTVEASPVNYAMFGVATQRLSPSQAMPPITWNSSIASAQPFLPLDLGQVSTGGAPVGDSLRISTPSAASAALSVTSGTSAQLLRAQLLALKLNVAVAATRGEPLASGFVYGRTISVQQVVNDADAFLASSGTSGTNVADLLLLAASVNQGKVTFRGPNATDPIDPEGDADADGIINRFDNCPTLSNIAQLDSDGNGMGDTCQCSSLTSVQPKTGVVSVLYRNSDVDVRDSSIRPQLQIANNTKVSIPLEDITLRYWYTNEASRAQVFNVDWAAIGAQKIRGAFARPTLLRQGSNSYLEIGFTSGSGSLAPNQSTGEIQARFNVTQWPFFDESDDYSRGTNSSYAFNVRVTAYIKGLLVWGQEPLPAYCAGGPYSLGTSVRLDYRVGDPGSPFDNQIRPVISIANTGATDIPLAQLGVRYCYTAELPASEVVAIGYSVIPSSLIATSIVTPDPVRPGANRCVQLAFSSAAGTLLAGGTTGEIQLQINKNTWTAYDESDDYSYMTNQVQLTPNTKVTVTNSGALLWGVKP